MAYSDYGGYAYKNGKRVKRRSDAVLTSTGIKSTPGAWPGFSIPLEALDSMQCFHVLLGNQDLLVGLYKSSHVQIILRGARVRAADFLIKQAKRGMRGWYKDDKNWRCYYLRPEYFAENKEPCYLSIEGIKIEIRWVADEKGHCQYVRAEIPGEIWCGFSGYGVGAGLENADYGPTTENCIATLKRFWNDAIN